MKLANMEFAKVRPKEVVEKMKQQKLLKTCVTMFGAQYNLSVPVAIELLLKARYGHSNPVWLVSYLDVSIFAGAIIGMLTMGYLGDAMGRSRGYIITLRITALGVLASGLVSFGSKDAVYWSIILSRFIVGIGIGGAYPLSATESFESKAGIGGAMSTGWTVFSQAWGQFAPYFLGFILSYGPITSSATYAEICLHATLTVGAIPALFALPLASAQSDSADFQSRDETKAVKNPRDAMSILWDPRYCYSLFGVASSWALFNVVSYGVALYSSNILEKIFSGTDEFRAEMWQNSMICALCIPACLVTVLLLKPLGTRRLQLVGLWTNVACFGALSVVWMLNANIYVVFCVYLVARASLWFGGGLTVFLISNEIFPTEIRSTCGGITAASSKIGAIIGVFGIPYLEPSLGVSGIFVSCVLVSLLNIVITVVCIPITDHDGPSTEKKTVKKPSSDASETDRLLQCKDDENIRVV